MSVIIPLYLPCLAHFCWTYRSLKVGQYKTVKYDDLPIAVLSARIKTNNEMNRKRQCNPDASGLVIETLSYLAELFYRNHRQWRLFWLLCQALEVTSRPWARPSAALRTARRARTTASLLTSTLRIMAMMIPHHCTISQHWYEGLIT